MPDSGIDYSDAPTLTEDFWKTAERSCDGEGRIESARAADDDAGEDDGAASGRGTADGDSGADTGCLGARASRPPLCKGRSGTAGETPALRTAAGGWSEAATIGSAYRTSGRSSVGRVAAEVSAEDC